MPPIRWWFYLVLSIPAGVHYTDDLNCWKSAPKVNLRLGIVNPNIGISNTIFFAWRDNITMLKDFFISMKGSMENCLYAFTFAAWISMSSTTIWVVRGLSMHIKNKSDFAKATRCACLKSNFDRRTYEMVFILQCALRNWKITIKHKFSVTFKWK